MTKVPHGAEIGVLGGGQLGRMFVAAAHRLGYRVAVYAPERGSPAGVCADREVVGDLSDVAAVRKFATSVAALTYETEAIQPAILDAAAVLVPVRPGPEVLRWTSDRMAQRELCAELGLPVADYRAIRTPDDVAAAASEPLFPGFLKRCREGYDGRGQLGLCCHEGLAEAWELMGRAPALLERSVDGATEFSVLVARGHDGETVVYDPIRNVHVGGVLRLSSWPAMLSDRVVAEAGDIARAIASRVGLCGVLCVELFLDSSGTLLVNEFAARPHNSGHLTIEACETSQFEQQVRALAGLPLGSGQFLRPAAMANLFGEVGTGPAVEPAGCGAFVHRYGKRGYPGRKTGHVTAVAGTVEGAIATALRVAGRVSEGSAAEKTAEKIQGEGAVPP